MMSLFAPEQALEFMRTNVGAFLAVAGAVRPHAQAGRLAFYCAVCRKVRHCSANDDWNMRNGIVCSACGHGGRQRHAFSVIEALLGEGHFPRRVIFEEVTPFKALLDQRFGAFRGSEYLGPDKQGGKAYQHAGRVVVHEDIGAASLQSESVDMVVTMDVLEHVPDLAIALTECWRILRKGGVHVMTVPFYDQKASVRRAAIVDGRLVHLLPAQFHGNPVSEDGALVFTEPGIDLLDQIREAGFDMQMSLGANLEHGLLPDGNSTPEAHCWNIVFVLRKP